jgi:hypothetical protein
MIPGPTYKDEDEGRGISGEKRKVENPLPKPKHPAYPDYHKK